MSMMYVTNIMLKLRSEADPRLLGALCKTVSTGGVVRVVMNETHLSVFHSISNYTQETVSPSVARYAFNLFFLSRARDFMAFTLHDLTD